MAEVIQFNCPACGTMLRLPLAMASHQGPCPNCDRDIIAPDPQRGIGAFEIPIPPPPSREIDPFRPFAEPSRIEETAAPVISEAPVQAQPTIVQIPVCAKPQRAILVLSCLLTGAVALAWGYALGVRSNQYFTRLPPMPPTVSKAREVEMPITITDPPTPDSVPVLVKPLSEAPKVEKIPVANKASSAAEASLRAFLDAPDWAARSAYALFPEKMRAAMESYSHEVPDGPTAFTSVSLKQSHIDEKTGNTLYIFQVVTDKYPSGIPVAIKETAGGWLVDWQAFVEFRDGLFRKFAEGPVDKTGHFHLIVTRPTPERAAKTENESFASFLLEAPLADQAELAFVKKSSETYSTLQSATTDNGIFTPVVEVVKRKTTGGQGYLQVLKITATDWLPTEN